MTDTNSYRSLSDASTAMTGGSGIEKYEHNLLMLNIPKLVATEIIPEAFMLMLKAISCIVGIHLISYFIGFEQAQ